jgi:ERCC4-type nuclease
VTALIVDSRETNSSIPALLRKAGVEVEQQELATGDYRIGEILIERKTATDLAASILDGRLFGQVEALCMASSRPMILLEGDIRGIRSEMNEAALPGAISALAVFFGMQLMWMPDVPSTVTLLERMWRHTRDGLGYEIPLRIGKPKPAPDGGAAQYLVEGLPGVGPETARKLIGHFGSARGVFQANVAALRQCKGVGPKTADAIALALDLRPTGFRSTKAGAE